MYVYVYVCVCVCVCVRARACVCVCVATCACACVHTEAKANRKTLWAKSCHKCTRTHTCSPVQPPIHRTHSHNTHIETHACSHTRTRADTHHKFSLYPVCEREAHGGAGRDVSRLQEAVKHPLNNRSKLPRLFVFVCVSICVRVGRWVAYWSCKQEFHVSSKLRTYACMGERV